jgi:hypothetical protein
MVDTLKYFTKIQCICEFNKRLWILFVKSLERISVQNVFSVTNILFSNFLQSNTSVCDDITTQVFRNLAAQLGNCRSWVHEVCRTRWGRLLLQKTPQKSRMGSSRGEGWQKMTALVTIKITVWDDTCTVSYAQEVQHLLAVCVLHDPLRV